MTEEELTALEAWLKTVSRTIFMATDAPVAESISHNLVKAADAIAELRRERDEALAMFDAQIEGHRLSAKDGTRNLIRAVNAEAGLEEMTRSCLAEREGRLAAEARVARLEAALRDAKAFHDRDSGCNGFTADYEILRHEIDATLDVKGAG